MIYSKISNELSDPQMKQAAANALQRLVVAGKGCMALFIGVRWSQGWKVRCRVNWLNAISCFMSTPAQCSLLGGSRTVWTSQKTGGMQELGEQTQIVGSRWASVL